MVDSLQPSFLKSVRGWGSGNGSTDFQASEREEAGFPFF
jgi:hypothetical protein